MEESGWSHCQSKAQSFSSQFLQTNETAMERKLNCILLIEDNNLTNIYNQKVIDRMAIAQHVQIAEDGQEGIEFIFKKGKYEQQKDISQPELIFLDINMPRMNGWEFIEEYRKCNAGYFSPVIIMLTSSPNPDDARLASNYPEIKGFSKKPLTVNIINEIMEEHFSS
jgi:CheY-like chemotaxis protein